MENLEMIKRNFNSIFEGKKVLVTGHTGFKGSWLSIWLCELGAQVIGYSLPPPTNPNNFHLCHLDKHLISIIGDLRDFALVHKVFEDYKPEIIFHLAAQSIVKLSYREPKLTYETNIMGLVNLLEAVRASRSAKAVLIVTSDKCYENKEWIWGYRETDEMGGYDPYSSSKGCAELITAAYRKSFFNSGDDLVHLASARAGNVIGGGDWSEDRIIPDCIRAITSGKKLTIRNPNSVRPWQYVLDPLSGYLWLVALLYEYGTKYASAWNFGPKPHQTATVMQLVEYLLESWGKEIPITISTSELAERTHESSFLHLDCSKAFHMLQWHALLDVPAVIEKTMNWYKKYFHGEPDLYNECIAQIHEYSQLAKNNSLPWVLGKTITKKD